MSSRLFKPPPEQSCFLFGPRGVGKTAWVHATYPRATVLDLLDDELYSRLLARPTLLSELVPAASREWVVIDEVQRIPALLNEVHRLIEGRKLRFVLTGSSARKLRRKGVNLLAGRALTCAMHPLTAIELGKDFELSRASRHGCLPFACTTADPKRYLASYVTTCLREEIQQEGLARNLSGFSRFLEVASLSQGCVLNRAAIARDSAVHAKVVEDYFQILEDLLIAIRVPLFTKRAKRKLITHPKFYVFDAGVFRAMRPRGPLDSPEEIDAPALETLFLQEARAVNDALDLGYSIHYWRTRSGAEVDFVLYGERGLHAFEIKRSTRLRGEDFKGLKLFREDYPKASARLLYLGSRSAHEGGIEVLPMTDALRTLDRILE